ncbi:hypothetical protein KGQ71_05280, partial [Patescibacteria group bacterium]|nr:hypothetical protein [Patescibacteria group bacterium]
TTRTLNTTTQGLVYIETGEHNLILHPVDAAASFSKSRQSFLEGSAQLEAAPLWLKIALPLPPLRWQVRFLRACQDLSLAGSTASQLMADYPTFHPEQYSDLSAFSADASSRFFNWYDQHHQDIAKLEQQLDQVRTELEDAPPWILLGQMDQVEQLTAQVNRLVGQLRDTDRLASLVSKALGHDDRDLHTILLVFQNTAGTYPQYGLITAQNGAIRSVRFYSDPNLPITPAADLKSQTVPLLVNHIRSQNNRAVDGIILTDNSVFQGFLTFPNPSAPDFEPALLQLIKSPDRYHQAVTAIRNGFNSGQLKIWSANQAIESAVP